MAFILKKVKPSEVLVKYGLGSQGDKPVIKRGGLAFIFPGLQGAKTMSLEPFSVDVDLTDALDNNNIRVNIPSTFTLAISDSEQEIEVAAKRLLDMNESALNEQVKDIIVGQLRVIIASMKIEEINSDRTKFEEMVEESITTELKKIGIKLISTNIRDVNDKAGYIEALGQRAEAEAKASAAVDIAKAEKEGTIGRETNESETVIKQAELAKERTLQTASLSKDTQTKEAQYAAELAEEKKENEIRKSAANNEVKIANIQFEKSQAVAQSEANIEKSEKLKEEILANKRANEVVEQEIEKEKQIIFADTEAEKILRKARAEAEAVQVQAAAEADRIEKISQAKADGYNKLVQAVGQDNVVSVMLAESAAELAQIQADALANLEIGNITLIGSGNSDNGSNNPLSSFVNDFMHAAPGYKALADAAGIEVDTILGKVESIESELKDSVDVAENIEGTETEESK